MIEAGQNHNDVDRELTTRSEGPCQTSSSAQSCNEATYNKRLAIVSQECSKCKECEVGGSRAWEDEISPGIIFVESEESKSVLKVKTHSPHVLGSQAIIYVCENGAELLVCKTPRTNTPAMLEISLNELHGLQQVKHDNIIQYRTHFMYNGVVNIVLSPLASCSLQFLLSSVQGSASSSTDLNSWFNNTEMPSERTGDDLRDTWHLKLWLSRQASYLADALAYLHKLRIRHGDIRPDNILVSSSGLLICDFGDVMDFKVDSTWCKPPMTQRLAEDVFMLGAVFLQMFSAFDQVLKKRSWELRHVIDGKHTYYDNYFHARPRLGAWIDAMAEETKHDRDALRMDESTEEELLRWLQVTQDILIHNDVVADEVRDRLSANNIDG